eukprot:1811730-Rhodomonas_salina.1
MVSGADAVRGAIREALFNTLIKEYGDSGRVHLAYSDEVPQNARRHFVAHLPRTYPPVSYTHLTLPTICSV